MREKTGGQGRGFDTEGRPLERRPPSFTCAMQPALDHLDGGGHAGMLNSRLRQIRSVRLRFSRMTSRFSSVLGATRALPITEWTAYLTWLYETDGQDRDFICAACRPLEGLGE